jgi:hypothetical protein
MNTPKRRRGRPHKKEEDKLIGRRVSMTQNDWDVIDEYISNKRLTLNHLMIDIAEIILLINHKEENQCESGQ